MDGSTSLRGHQVEVRIDQNAARGTGDFNAAHHLKRFLWLETGVRREQWVG
jgi:hypothetical protein